MAVAPQKTVSMTGDVAEEIIHWIRSEPALAWFAAQAMWMAQPALEIFWPPESITALAETLEAIGPSAGETPSTPGEGGV
ncbi:MAG: hypothetical protein WBM17_11770 [Anaerolineales bacterium]